MSAPYTTLLGSNIIRRCHGTPCQLAVPGSLAVVALAIVLAFISCTPHAENRRLMSQAQPEIELRRFVSIQHKLLLSDSAAISLFKYTKRTTSADRHDKYTNRFFAFDHNRMTIIAIEVSYSCRVMCTLELEPRPHNHGNSPVGCGRVPNVNTRNQGLTINDVNVGGPIAHKSFRSENIYSDQCLSCYALSLLIKQGCNICFCLPSPCTPLFDRRCLTNKGLHRQTYVYDKTSYRPGEGGNPHKKASTKNVDRGAAVATARRERCSQPCPAYKIQDLKTEKSNDTTAEHYRTDFQLCLHLVHR